MTPSGVHREYCDSCNRRGCRTAQRPPMIRPAERRQSPTRRDSDSDVYNEFGYLVEVRYGAEDALAWRAEEIMLVVSVLEEKLGNGLETIRTFDAETGLVTRIQTGSLQDLSFTYDRLGNLTERVDHVAGTKRRLVTTVWTAGRADSLP